MESSKGTALRKLILMFGVSVDGFIEGPDRDIDWHMVDDELHGYINVNGLSREGATTHPSLMSRPPCDRLNLPVEGLRLVFSRPETKFGA